MRHYNITSTHEAIFDWTGQAASEHDRLYAEDCALGVIRREMKAGDLINFQDGESSHGDVHSEATIIAEAAEKEAFKACGYEPVVYISPIRD